MGRKKTTKEEREKYNGTLLDSGFYVIEWTGEVNKHGDGLYRVICPACGQETIKPLNSVKRSKSCGCARYSQENNKKRSEKLKNRVFSDETKKKMSESGLKFYQTEKGQELKKEKSKIMTGTHQSEETIKKRSMKMRGENHPLWKGGDKSIYYILDGLPEIGLWKKKALKARDYTCELTGKRGCKLHVHHLKGFNILIQEAHVKNNIPCKKMASEYTEEEIEILKNHIIKEHENLDNAVVLDADIHMMFHNFYGRGNNTPEQFNEFREMIDQAKGEIMNK